MNSLDFYLALLFGCKRDVARVAGKVDGLTDCVFTGLCGALPEAKREGGGVQGVNNQKYRNVKKVFLVLVVVMFAVIGCGGGEKANGVYVGQSVKEFISIFEQKYKVEKATIFFGGVSLDGYNIFEKDEKLFFVYPLKDNPDIVSAILIVSPQLKTEKGIGVGSTLAELQSNYKIFGITEYEQLVFVVVEELSASIGVIFIESFDSQNFDVQTNFFEKANRGEMPTPADIFTLSNICVFLNDSVIVTIDKRIIARYKDKHIK